MLTVARQHINNVLIKKNLRSDGMCIPVCHGDLTSNCNDRECIDGDGNMVDFVMSRSLMKVTLNQTPT